MVKEECKRKSKVLNGWSEKVERKGRERLRKKEKPVNGLDFPSRNTFIRFLEGSYRICFTRSERARRR